MIETLMAVAQAINESPFFISGSGFYLFVMMIGNLVVTFIIAFIAAFNATHVAEGSHFNKKTMKDAVKEALEERDRSKP